MNQRRLGGLRGEGRDAERAQRLNEERKIRKEGEFENCPGGSPFGRLWDRVTLLFNRVKVIRV
jgi:hypothetical protein